MRNMSQLNYTPGKWRQTMAALIMNMASFNSGISVSWTATMTRRLEKNNDSLVTEFITDDDISWLMATGTVGILLSLIFGSKLCEHIGRKYTTILTALMFISGWLMRLLADKLFIMQIAQIWCGIGDGIALLIIPLYVTEMSSNSIRGQLGSLFMFGVKAGYFFAFVLSALLSYEVFTYCCLMVPSIQLVGLLFVPEAPVYLVRNGRLDEARKSLMWLRGNDIATADAELIGLKRFHLEIMQAKSSLSIKDLFTDRANLKGLLISMSMVVIQQGSGIFVMMTYIMMIMDAANLSASTHLASIIFASSQIIGCWLSTVTVDRFGRRPLLLFSTSGMALSYTALSIFFVMQHAHYNVTDYNWLPIVAVSMYSVAYSSGAGPLPMVVSNEVFNPELASLCHTIFLAGFNTIAFIYTKFFPAIVAAVGLHNSFFIFVANCIVGFFIVLFLTPETKGKSIESIRGTLQGVGNKMNETVE